MRALTKKQKQLIEKHVNINGLDFIGLLSYELEKINDYETLYCDVVRYAEDYYYNNGGRLVDVLHHF